MQQKANELRVSIDTNLVVSALLYPERSPGRIVKGWQNLEFTVIISEDHEGEIRHVLDRPWLEDRYHVTPEDKEGVLLGLELAEVVEPAAVLPLTIRDPDDAKILAAAIGGQADYLVTGDNDLLSLAGDDRLENLTIASVAEFVQILDQQAHAQLDPAA